MTTSHHMALLLGLALLFAQSATAQPTDDPMERFPPGVTEPAHRHIAATGGKVDKTRVHPPHWWVGMAESQVEVLLYDQDIADLAVTVAHPGVRLVQAHRQANPNYRFVLLDIGPGTQPGTFDIVLSDGRGRTLRYPYELKAREPLAGRQQGLTTADVIYLIMPDRFANGDPSNDDVPTMQQRGIRRDKVFFRHGGDLLGVMERLDYLQDLGVTALWLNPILENDQPYESYHGYAVSDHYNVDARFGTNETYRQLVDKAHARGMKVVMDIVHNHVGDQHFLIRDLPGEDWIHQFPEFTRTTYRETTLMDPYAAEADRALMTDAWFDHHMPDLNQQNPHLARYLTQNNIWWTEYSGHDAFRIDTYAYNDQAFMAEWGRRMKAEFPQLSLFAETWVHGTAVQAQFTQNNQLREGYNSHMPAVTDFQVHYGIMEALSRPQGWTDGVMRLYYTLAQDFLYENPYRNVIFLDNHDLPRLYSTLGQDGQKFRSALALLFTMRGIPCMYYGTELQFEGSGGAFGEGGRIDFPGGWREDEVDKFKPKGRTAAEQATYDYVKALAHYRRTTPALQDGRLTQFVPMDGVYVYFRHDAQKTVMVATNTHGNPATVDTARFRERMAGFTKAKDVTTGKIVEDIAKLQIAPHTTLVLELMH